MVSSSSMIKIVAMGKTLQLFFVKMDSQQVWSFWFVWFISFIWFIWLTDRTNEINETNQRNQMNQINGLLISGLFLFNILDRLFERLDKSLRLSQSVFRQLEFRDQHAGFVDNNQPIALFHSDAPS